jgi:hypothetical protein
MKFFQALVLFVLVAGAAVAVFRIETQGEKAMARESQTASASALCHDVFFTLAERTPERRQELVDACRKYLVDHPGTVFFAVGTLNTELTREVNDVEFDVALHIVFKDKEAHDVYQTSDRHVEFVNKSKHLWNKVRVFDSDVEVAED